MTNTEKLELANLAVSCLQFPDQYEVEVFEDTNRAWFTCVDLSDIDLPFDYEGHHATGNYYVDLVEFRKNGFPTFMVEYEYEDWEYEDDEE